MNKLTSMTSVIVVYGIILSLGISSLMTGIHYFANVAGFIAAVGFMVVFFKDVPDNLSAEKIMEFKKFKKYWYVVFGFGLFFSLILGSLWNNKMGGMI